MACTSGCGTKKCGCKKVVTKYGLPGKPGRPGLRGKAGTGGGGAALTVRDAQGVPTIVSNVTEIRFTDANAVVTDLGGGIAQVSLVPAATVWNDIQGLSHYVAGSESFRPQYTIEGNRISFRGLLYLPLESGGSLVNISTSNSYLGVASATLHSGSVTVINNANTNNGTPQGRFITSDVVATRNFPANATPGNRDIVFNDVPCFRRYSGGGRVAVYRSFVDIRIGCDTTVYVDPSAQKGIGCLMVFSPFNNEYDGSGTPPLGNDPLALGISRGVVDEGIFAADYITATDDNVFTVPASPFKNPFAVNAHHINELGGFIINLEGLSGYIN